MGLGTNAVLHIVLAIFLGGLMVIFIYRSTRNRHYVPFFLMSFTSVFLGSFIYINLVIFTPSLSGDFLAALELLFYGNYLFFMFLFLESLQKINIISIRVIIGFILLVIQQVTIIILLTMDGNSEVRKILWFITDLCYNSMGILVYGIVGVTFYFKNYQKTKARPSWLLIRIFLLIGIGYMILFWYDLCWFFDVELQFSRILNNIGNVITIIGVLAILTIFIVNINHFYLDTHDLFLFMITDKQGKIIFSSQFLTEDGKSLSEASLDQLLPAINTIFINTFNSKKSLTFQISKHVSLLREANNNFSVVIVANLVSLIMRSALRRFMRVYEEKIDIEAGIDPSDSHFIEITVDILADAFPFLTNISQTKIIRRS